MNTANAYLESIKNSCKTINQVTDAEYMTVHGKTQVTESANQIVNASDFLMALIEDSNKTNFSSWLNQYYDFLNNLSLHQESSFVNILLFLILMFSVFNFLSIFFGNEIIKYFNLENKFPSLATFFKLRTKFKKYYLLWSIFLLFVVCSVGIFINLLILL